MPKLFANILVVKTHAIGDVLMATPALRALRKAYPDARITMLVGKWSHPIVADNPHVDDFLIVDEAVFFGRKVSALLQLVRDLRSRHFDLAVVLHPSRKMHLFSLLAKIPFRIGLQRERKSPFLTTGVMENGDSQYYYPRNFLELLRVLDIYDEDATLEASGTAEDWLGVQQELETSGWYPGRPYIVVAPGGARNPKEAIAARLWPESHYRALLHGVQKQYPGLRIVLSGGPGDRELCARLAADCPGAIDLSGRTTLGGLVTLVSHARVVVCNDSSLLHIALARSTEVITFFGPTSAPSRVPDVANAHALQAKTLCSPCYQYAVFPGCNRGIECMHSIAPERAMQELDRILARKRPAILLDRDGTLVDDPGYLRRVEDIRWLPGVLDALRRLSEAGYVLATVSNQSGLARGYFTESVLSRIETRIASDAAAAGGALEAQYHCPHLPEVTGPCTCRKPANGMVEQAIAELGLDRAQTWMVGDSERDAEAGLRSGLRAALVGKKLPSDPEVRHFSDLPAFADWLLSHQSNR